MNIQGNKEHSVTEGLPTRYRFTDQDGKSYAPFRLKPGVRLFEIVSHAFPDADDFEVQVVGAGQ